MYQYIVIAYDDSEFSKAALSEASCWIKNHGGKAVLAHSVFFDKEEFTVAHDQREKRFELGKQVCYAMQEKTSAAFGLNGNLEALVCEGEPYEVVVDIARERKADLIAIGTHGRKGLKKLFLGSVTSRVLASSPCDVLVVKKTSETCTGNFKSILLSFDGSQFSKRALTRACELSKYDGAAITALYVVPRYEEELEFFATPHMRVNLRYEAEEIMKKAKEFAADRGVELTIEITEGDEAERIAETAQLLKSGLIVRGTHSWAGINRAIIGSIAERVIIDAPCPVLVVK
jgi:nucleotide-binding universal stress UspA family protein